MSKSFTDGMIISAGFSSRMGEFKPLMLYRQKSFIVEITEKLLKVCNKVYVVSGYRKEDVESEMRSEFNGALQTSELNLIFNPDYELGMLTSLQQGLRCIAPSTDWLIYHFVDQPTIPRDFYNQLIEEAEAGYDWIQPSCKGRYGHPVLLNKKLFKPILELSAGDSLLNIKEREDTRVKIWNCGFPEILDNLNSPEDLKEKD